MGAFACSVWTTAPRFMQIAAFVIDDPALIYTPGFSKPTLGPAHSPTAGPIFCVRCGLTSKGPPPPGIGGPDRKNKARCYRYHRNPVSVRRRRILAERCA